ncbi:capreomycidine synthase [Streptomyces sp. NPDC049099]|uniref:capreomycidine synthase n=1 Tax=Streptomyces sp. NPDC049099 TaxID=3155768 RepID=UPI00341F78DA
MQLRRAPLEDWLRDSYFDARIDISSSGVEPYSMAELFELTGLEPRHLAEVTFRDSRSCGAPELRSAIAQRWGDGDPSRVMVTHGSGEAQYMVLTTLLRPGDEVVVVEPAYHTLVGIAEAIGCTVVPWRLRFEDGFVPDLDALASLVTPRTRAVIANFPHNPTGISVDAQAQRRIVDTARAHGAYLIWDSVFADMRYDGHLPANPAMEYDRAISFGTFSKGLGLPGLRVGWCFAPEPLIDKLVVMRDYTTLALSPLVEQVALHAVRGADALLVPKMELARRNLSVLDSWMAEHDEKADWVRPHGGVVAFPRLRGVDDEQFCDRLMREHGVLLIPGRCFGMPGHVRLGFGVPTDQLRDGLDRMSRLLDETR